ncbi:MAG TPA: class I SAM-dependent methyltransferase [Planctomycetota bacterium]|nr:class I SAM-dependent methyltransferase [Planctomycetota bacterium]
MWLRRSAEVLAEYREAADAGFWQRRWGGTDLARYLAGFRGGRLGYFEAPFRRHLPKDAPVLEAGCGRAQYVMALSRLGYDVFGVEYAEDTVRAVREVEPSLQVTAGDLRTLPFPDGFFGGYISLGVIEHYWGGPGAILAEARRVLRKDGVMLLSVPHFSPGLRRLVEGREVGEAREREDFYQFYFTRGAIEETLRTHGFRPFDAFYYDAVYGAKRAYPAFLKMYEKSKLFRYSMTRLNRLALPQAIVRRFSHMVLIAARRA